jgi:hypothetical protein
MRLATLTLLALGGLVATPVRAAAPSLFETFRAVCYATHADPSKALAAAGAGWTDAPATGADPDGLKAHRTRTIGGATWDLKLIQTEVAAGADQAPFPKRLRICLISTTAPTSGLQAATRDLLGGTAGQESSHGLGWAYFDGAPRRYITGALTPAETNAGLAKDPLDIIVANETDAGAAIAITDVRKAGK